MYKCALLLNPNGWKFVVVVVPSAHTAVDCHVQTIAVATSVINQSLTVIGISVSTSPGHPRQTLGVSSPHGLNAVNIAFGFAHSYRSALR